MGNTQGAQSGFDLNGMPLGTGMAGTDPAAGDLQPDAVEVVEVVTLEGSQSPFDQDLYGTQTPSLFRWWYVPAVAVPIVAGGALIWYLRKGQQPYKDFSALLGRQGNHVSGWVQDRFQATRQPPNVARKRAALAATAATAPIWDRAGDWLNDRLYDFEDLIDRDRARHLAATARDRARNQLKQATKTTKATTTVVATSNRWDDLRDLLADTGETVGDTVSEWWAGLRGTTAPTAPGKAHVRRDQVRGNAKSASTKAALVAGAGKAAATAAKPVAATVSAVSGAKSSTARAAKQTGKSVNSAYKQTRTFTFAMLVAALYTYMRMWRQHINERTMRETANGRLEPDREPMFSR
jgi:hypothetical protein